MNYYSKHIYFGGHSKKQIEVINLYSDQQRYTFLRNDAILSLSLLPEDARGVNLRLPLSREPTPIKRSVLYASPLVTTDPFYDVTLSAEELRAVLSPFVCVGHLNLNLCVYEPQTASPSSAFASQYLLSVAL